MSRCETKLFNYPASVVEHKGKIILFGLVIPVCCRQTDFSSASRSKQSALHFRKRVANRRQHARDDTLFRNVGKFDYVYDQSKLLLSLLFLGWMYLYPSLATGKGNSLMYQLAIPFSLSKILQ